jgi:hypothetical protein
MPGSAATGRRGVDDQHEPAAQRLARDRRMACQRAEQQLRLERAAFARGVIRRFRPRLIPAGDEADPGWLY